MGSHNRKYGIFLRNDVVKDLSAVQKVRTVFMGQICMIEPALKNGLLQVRFLKDKDGETWESQTFLTEPEDCVLLIPDKLWQYIVSIASPQERVKFARNKKLCEKLSSVCCEMVVGFTDSDDVKLGKIKYKGPIKGLGYGFGLELHENKRINKCSGSYSGIQYFQCLPGRGLFTTIERIVPAHIIDSPEPQKPALSDLEIFMKKNISNLTINSNGFDDRPPREEIVTKYGEYSKKLSTPARSVPLNHNMRNSVSLQNILEVDDGSVNTNNDFDQNTIIQPDCSQLMNVEKLKNKSEMDLHDFIGMNRNSQSEAVTLRKNLDKNDNVKEKYSPLLNRNSTISSNGTLSRRNKSANPISHLIDGAGLSRKSKFYMENNYVENGFDKAANVKKAEIGKKLVDYHHAPAKEHLHHQSTKPTATFYVIGKSKYTEPLPGTTNDLVCGSLVEVGTDVTEQPLYGVIRWMGYDAETDFTLVGIELEDDLPSDVPLTLTDGAHNGERYFKCSSDRAFFVPLERCRKDPRFQVPSTPVHQAPPSEVNECSVIPGAVAPLCMPTEEDVQAVCGKYRGIQGHHNSCYLDVTLFSMFTYTAVFDSLLFRPKNQNDIADYEEVQRVLREEIVNPLRKNLYVNADNVMKLRRLLDRLSSVSGLTSEEKDPEEFLNSLLAQILKAEPFLKLNSGQTAFHYQLFVEKNAELSLPTVQQLFEQSFLTSDIKLSEVPSCLIIQMPRFGKNYKMYPRILPSQLLDVTDVIEGSPRQCMVCGKLAQWECKECFAECSSSEGLESTAFCTICLKTAHKHERRQHHRPRKLAVNEDFLAMQEQYKPSRLFMELFAVICIETSHYVAFVKCGVGHEAPWCFFDSMADRKGERDGYNIPEMVACPDISRWLSDEEAFRQLHEDFPVDRHLPEHARRLLCDAYICMYQSSDVMMYR
ncbi:ubiquitin carboxyl-terminal hydrolase CYLD [Euwallacea similis]|uniref:ubiquitin carboxyl-terminal hydrolase CYLD n=1 Tax=Euwallacea similis TaxID=1736056 RepID=UPI00344FF5B1